MGRTHRSPGGRRAAKPAQPSVRAAATTPTTRHRFHHRPRRSASPDASLGSPPRGPHYVPADAAPTAAP